MSDNIITPWYFEFRSKPLHITVICMDPHSPNKSIATKYCFLILGDDTSFFFLIISLFFFSFLFLLFYVILLLLVFTKIFLLLLFYFFYFSWKLWKLFFFSMFRDAPVCSGFYRRPFHTPVDRIFVISSKLNIANKCVQFVQIYNNDPRSNISTSC